MENFITLIQTYFIWFYALVILIGGRYWGVKYFTVFKNKATNFLFFATVFATVWAVGGFLLHTYRRETLPGLFFTYLFTTSFYELLGKRLMETIDGIFVKRSVEKQEAKEVGSKDVI